MAKSNLPIDSKLAARKLDADSVINEKKTDQGLFGVLGDSQHKPGNIACLAIVLAFVLIFSLLFAPIDPSIDKADLFALAGTVVTGALGFVFGRASQQS